MRGGDTTAEGQESHKLDAIPHCRWDEVVEDSIVGIGTVLDGRICESIPNGEALQVYLAAVGCLIKLVYAV